jgi:BASS family bile acid:Na+ symporter
MIDEVQLNFNQDNIWVLNFCLAIIMFGVALELRVEDFKRVFYNPKSSLVGLLSQFILLPALTFVLIIILEPSPSLALGMILVSCCPGGNISNFMTHLARGNSALSVSLTAVGTVLAILATPFNFELWGSLYPPTASILKSVSGQRAGLDHPPRTGHA